MKEIAIYGGGSWGTALACQAARKQSEVNIFVNNDQIAHEISNNSTNSQYLGDITLPPNIKASTDLSCILNKEIIIIAVSSAVFPIAVERLKNAGLNPNVTLLIATKGLVGKPTQLLSEMLKKHLPNQVAFIAGPNFAKEVAQNFLTAATIACEDINLATELSQQLTSENFTITATNDIITIQIAGTMKNIIAIKSGIYEAIGHGENARAALITQGIKEIMLLSQALGGKIETLLEPAVLGDVMLTCYSKTSRNTKFGYELAKQDDTATFLKNYPYLVEGKESVHLVIDLAKKYNINLPIVQSVAEKVR